MIRFLPLLLLFAPALFAQDALPPSPDSPGFHQSTVALAEYCLEYKLYSEAAKLCASVTGDSEPRATEIIAACKDRSDTYTAASWGGYLDRREAVMRRRALGATEAGWQPNAVLGIDPDYAPAREKLGFKRLECIGWLKGEEHDRLAPCVVALKDAPNKQDREATWDQPWVVAGQHFTLVTDLPWTRAVKYAEYLDRFEGIFFELLGDTIPRRDDPNVVYCCKDAETFVAFTTQAGHPMTKENGGLHVGALNAVFINAERCDYVGHKNKSWDNLARTMFHECAHRLVEIGLRGRRAPRDFWGMMSTKEHAWIVESIAIVFEDLQLDAKGYKLAGLEDQRTYTIEKHWKGNDKAPPGLEPVLTQGFSAFATGSPISNAEKYALAGSVAWFCLFERKADYRAAYLNLLVDYYRNDTTGRDWQARFGKPLAEFEKEWKSWVVK
jgi:hypothetical protein